MASLTDRMIRAAKLDPQLYEEVEADQNAMGQAMTVVVLAAVAAGIGSLAVMGIRGLVFGTISALIGWFVWAYIVFFVGTKILPGKNTEADYGQLLRTIGFSSSPGVIRVLGFIPGIGMLISFAASIWMLVAMVIAVRQALDYESTGRAVVVCVIGLIIYLLVMALLVSLFGGMGMAA